MKKILLTLLIFTKTFYAQKTKIFKDNYNDGEMTYNYYVDPQSSEMIKHGKFTYIKKLNNKNTNGTYSLIVNGFFEHGQRNGVFKYNIRLKDFPNKGGTYTTENSYAILTYLKGIPNGKWEININRKSRDFIFKNGRYVWSKFGENSIQFAKTNFKRGVATGLTSFKDYGMNSRFSFKLNNNGFITGKYVFNDNLNIYDLNFDSDGVLLQGVIRNKNGKVEHKENIDPKLTNIVKQYKKGSLTAKEMKFNRIAIDTMNNRLTFLDYNHIFEQEPFLFRFIEGDKTLSNKTSKTSRIYKRFLDVKKVAFIDLQKNQVYKSISYRVDNLNKAENLQYFLKENQANLTDEDIAKIQNKINSIIENQKREKENEQNKTLFKKKKDFFYEEISKIDTQKLFKNNLGGNTVIKIFNDDIKKVNLFKILQYDEFNLTHPDLVSFDTNKTYEVDTINYAHKLNKINDSISKTDKVIKPLINKLKKIDSLTKKTDFIIFKVKCHYKDFSLPEYYQYKKINKNTSSKTYRKYLKIQQAIKEKKEKEKKSEIDEIASLFSFSSSSPKEKLFEQYEKIITQLTNEINKQNIAEKLDKINRISNKLIEHKMQIKNRFVKKVVKSKNIEDKINLILNKE